LGSDELQNDKGSKGRVMAQWFAALTRLVDVGHSCVSATKRNREIQRVVGQLAVGKLDELQQRYSQLVCVRRMRWWRGGRLAAGPDARREGGVEVKDAEQGKVFQSSRDDVGPQIKIS
jgi:hypothetical protein